MEPLTSGYTRPLLHVESRLLRFLHGLFRLYARVESRDSRIVVLGGDHILSFLDVRVLLVLDERILWHTIVLSGVVFFDSSWEACYRIGQPFSMGYNPT